MGGSRGSVVSGTGGNVRTNLNNLTSRIEGSTTAKQIASLLDTVVRRSTLGSETGDGTGVAAGPVMTQLRQIAQIGARRLADVQGISVQNATNQIAQASRDFSRMLGGAGNLTARQAGRRLRPTATSRFGVLGGNEG